MLLGREELQRAFVTMSELLFRRGLVCRDYVVGGSVMVFAFEERDSPRAVDSRYTSASGAVGVVAEVGRRLGVPPS